MTRPGQASLEVEVRETVTEFRGALCWADCEDPKDASPAGCALVLSGPEPVERSVCLCDVCDPVAAAC